MKFTFHVTVLREARPSEDTDTGRRFFKIPGPVRGWTVNSVTCEEIHAQLGNVKTQTLIIISSQVVIEEAFPCMYIQAYVYGSCFSIILCHSEPIFIFNPDLL